MSQPPGSGNTPPHNDDRDNSQLILDAFRWAGSALAATTAFGTIVIFIDERVDSLLTGVVVTTTVLGAFLWLRIAFAHRPLNSPTNPDAPLFLLLTLLLCGLLYFSVYRLLPVNQTSLAGLWVTCTTVLLLFVRRTDAHRRAADTEASQGYNFWLFSLGMAFIVNILLTLISVVFRAL